ncbi:MAG: iron-sulfur cluster assembly scaffold protein [Alphaproteobacteria bacterium]|nr:iron-sulfur cluster assembly scaffold protein [Alphaproteobacteria bacterium]MDE2043096.1 iron-sulfur cluster assembly scaffold protein [Alphaproteobacteria bacterium]MDE2341396.1 iron-sulfur cluster assembly scaffold protein [Alphaproteobacteria bacterium]
MNAPLYTTEILRLAVTIPHQGVLAGAQGVVEKRSAICGSWVLVMLDVDAAGRVARFAQDVRACALGQASAALLGAHVMGANGAALAAARDQLAAYLSGARAAPPDWPGLEIFASAIPHSARHAAIRLPFEATTAALVQAQAAQLHAA